MLTLFPEPNPPALNPIPVFDALPMFIATPFPPVDLQRKINQIKSHKLWIGTGSSFTCQSESMKTACAFLATYSKTHDSPLTLQLFPTPMPPTLPAAAMFCMLPILIWTPSPPVEVQRKIVRKELLLILIRSVLSRVQGFVCTGLKQQSPKMKLNDAHDMWLRHTKQRF